MPSLRYIVPALVVAIGAAAQSSSCSAAGTSTIQSQADATALSTCQTFDGSIAIASSTTDNIDLTGIQRITGDLVANNVTGMTQLTAGTLTSIGGVFNLQQLTILGTLNFPVLVSVGSIMWTALPALSGLSFTNGVQTLMDMDIDNTFLASLTGINLQTARTIMISNNPYLNTINMQLGNVTNSLQLNNNGPKLVASFPNLIWANNLTLRGCSEIDTPSLASINGSLGIYQSTLDSYAAPNLTTVGQAFSLVSNGMLSNLSMPQLTTIGGGFTLVNDSSLQAIDGFPQLARVGGAIILSGDIHNASLPSLTDVRGAFELESTVDVSDSCSAFKKYQQSKVIKGNYTCTPTGGSTNTSSPSGTTNAGGASSTAKSAASAMIIPGATTGILSVIAVMFGLL